MEVRWVVRLHGANAVPSALSERDNGDAYVMQAPALTANITQVLNLDVLAIVLGAYGYRDAAKSSRVCTKFRDAVKRVQFWQRGLKVELRSFLQRRAIPVHVIAVVVPDYDPFYNANGETVSIHLACVWIFSKRAAHDINAMHSMISADGSERMTLGFGLRIRYLWNFTTKAFIITMGNYSRQYGRIHGHMYHIRMVRENGMIVNTDKIHIEP